MKKTIRAARRLACALGIVCAGFAGVSAAQQKVQMGVPTIGDYIAVYVAYDEGIFAKHARIIRGLIPIRTARCER